MKKPNFSCTGHAFGAPVSMTLIDLNVCLGEKRLTGVGRKQTLPKVMDQKVTAEIFARGIPTHPLRSGPP